MADYTKNISNTVNIFGMEASTKWGDANGFAYTMVWGVSKWGYGTNTIVFKFEKLISDSIILDSAIFKESQKIISNSISISEDMYSEKLSLEGWNYIFPSNTNEGESRISTTWATSSQSTQSYTCQTVSTTTWV